MADYTPAPMLALALVLALAPLAWGGRWLLTRSLGVADSAVIEPETPEADARRERARVLARLWTQLLLAGVILGFPLLRGQSIPRYYADRLRSDVALPLAAWGAAAVVLLLALLYLAWLQTDCVRFERRGRLGKTLKRLAIAPLSAAFGAGVEELLFRAVLLDALLADLPRSAAVAIGAVIFAAAHYVRPVKRYWTIWGHVALGLCLCQAYVVGGWWLAFGIHAGGILVIMGVRPFVRYRGPAWICGESIFPFAGVVGIAALLGLASALPLLTRGTP